MFWNLTGINYQVWLFVSVPPSTTKYRLLGISGIFAEFFEILGLLMKRYFIIHVLKKRLRNDKWFLTKGIQL